MNKRDLKADLELCNRATPGPWIETDESNLEVFVENTWGDPVLYEIQHDGPHTAIRQEDMEFLIEAREGWPYAIERAIEAEELNRELVEALKKAHEYIGDINSFYGQGLQVYGWHFNGALEPLDNFIDSNGGCEVEEFVGRVLTKAKEVLGDE